MFLQSARAGDSATVGSSPGVDAAASRLSGWDYAGMLTGLLLTLAICVANSRGRIFWEDEMLGWMLLRDPSWHHMIEAWNLGADGGGFSFYVLGRAWFALVGASALSFRLFSAVGFGIGFVAVWAGLRRFYPTWIVAFAAFDAIFFSPPLAMHFIEGRFYGLLFMATALAMWLALVLDDVPDPTPTRLYLAAFVIHGLLTTSHLLGVVFSAFVLSSTVALDLLAHRRRLGLYLTAAASWLLLIPERTSIIAAGKVGKPHFWTTPPNKWDVIGVYSGYSREIQIVLLSLLLLAGVALWRSPGGFRHNLAAAFHRRRAVYLVALSLLLVPCAFLIEGFFGTWLFNHRYLLPVTLGLSYAIAELLQLAAEHIVLPSWVRRSPGLFAAATRVAGACFAALLLFWEFHHVAMYTPEAPDFTQALTDHMPHNLPVVVEDAFTFTGLIGTQANSGVHYTFLLDWPNAVRNDAPRLEVTQYHLMQNWKLAGYYPEFIQNVNAFLRENPRFLVVHNSSFHPDPKATPEIGNFIAARLAHDPNYELHEVFTLDRAFHDNVRDTVWLLCRGGCGNTTTSPISGANYCVLWAANTPCCSDQACLAALPPKIKAMIK